MFDLLRREPVRMWIYSILVPLVALLAYYGVVDGDSAQLILALAAAVLGVQVTEHVRSTVTPVDPDPGTKPRTPATT